MTKVSLAFTAAGALAVASTAAPAAMGLLAVSGLAVLRRRRAGRAGR